MIVSSKYIIVATRLVQASGSGSRVLRLIGFRGSGVGNLDFPLKKHALGELIHHQPEAVPPAPGCADFAFRSSPRQDPPPDVGEMSGST